jgi:hypothetical protein
MQQLLSFWYGQSPNWVYQRFLQTIRILDGRFAVQAMIKNITRPIFQDYDWQGRVIGFFIRIGRIVAAVIVYILTLIVYLIAYTVWLAFPVLCVVSLVGAVMGTI